MAWSKLQIGGLVSGAVAGLLVAALAAPSFVDWNAWKPQIEQAVEARIDRDLRLDGDLSLGLLPMPFVEAHDVGLANVAGATRGEAVALRSARLRFNPLWLLVGRISVDEVVLDGPSVALEVLDDGTASWTFTTAEGERATGEMAAAELDAAPWDGRVAGFSLRVWDVQVRGATATLRDATGALPDVDAEGVDLDASLVGTQLQVARFEGTVWGGLVTAGGSANAGPGYAHDLELTADGVDPTALLTWLGYAAEVHAGPVSLTASSKGEVHFPLFDHLDQLDLHFEGATPHATAYGWSVTQARATGGLVDGLPTLDAFSAAIYDGTVSGRGTYDLGGDQAVRLTARADGLSMEGLLGEFDYAETTERGRIDGTFTGGTSLAAGHSLLGSLHGRATYAITGFRLLGVDLQTASDRVSEVQHPRYLKRLFTPWEGTGGTDVETVRGSATVQGLRFTTEDTVTVVPHTAEVYSAGWIDLDTYRLDVGNYIDLLDFGTPPIGVRVYGPMSTEARIEILLAETLALWLQTFRHENPGFAAAVDDAKAHYDQAEAEVKKGAQAALDAEERLVEEVQRREAEADLGNRAREASGKIESALDKVFGFPR